MQELKKKKLLIFDMDGTLYAFEEGSFAKSKLKKQVLKNAKVYIAEKLNKTKKEAENILKEIERKYGEDISIGLEKNFGLDRYEYFKTVWDIPANNYIQENLDLRKKLLKIRPYFEFLVLSDAPMIWIKNVLKALRVRDIFQDKIFSGEGDLRKRFGNIYEEVIKRFKIKAKDCIAFGDQEETDIIPAKKLGMKTVFVHPKQQSTLTDCNICSIIELEKTLKELIPDYERRS